MPVLRSEELELVIKNGEIEQSLCMIDSSCEKQPRKWLET